MFLPNALRVVQLRAQTVRREKWCTSVVRNAHSVLLTLLVFMSINANAQTNIDTASSSVFPYSSKALDNQGLAVGDSEKPINQTRVIGGSLANEGAWPSLVALVMPGDLPLRLRQFCGGSIIADRWVLTAAHCLFNQDGSPTTADQVRVVAGINDLEDQNAIETVVTNVYTHPQYQNILFPVNDIALLELATTVASPQNALLTVDPEVLVGRNAFIAGWGALTEQGPITPERFPSLLHEASMPIVSRAQCNLPESYDGYISESQLCAGFREGGVDSCQGDSGGPIYVLEGAQQVQIGVTSFGAGCAQPNLYGVYTSVNAYRSWMQNYINVTGSAAKTETAVKVGVSDFAAALDIYLLALLAGFGGLSLNRHRQVKNKRIIGLLLATAVIASGCTSSPQKPNALAAATELATKSKSIVTNNTQISVSNVANLVLSSDNDHAGLNQFAIGISRQESADALAALGFNVPNCEPSKTAIKGTGRLFLQELCEAKPINTLMLAGLSVELLKFHVLDNRLIKLEVSWQAGNTSALTTQLDASYKPAGSTDQSLEWRLGLDHIRIVTSANDAMSNGSGMSLQMIDGRMESKLPSLFE